MSDSHDRNRDLERQAAEARKKLDEAEQRAEETIEHAETHLHELVEEQNELEERLRSELKKSMPPAPPASSQDKDEA